MAALGLLSESEGASVEAVAAALGVTLDAASSLLDDLEALGLLESSDVH